MKLIDHNPASGIRLGKSPDPVIRFYEPEQLVDLIDKIADEGNQIVAPVILAAYYGMRREEALGLEWSAIDFRRNKVTIRRTAIKTNAGVVYEDTVKSKSSLRSMPLLPEVAVYLKNLQRQQKQMQAMLKKSYVRNDAVCKWDDGRLVSPDYVTHRFKELIEKYDLPPLTFHQLRHSSASLLINDGYSLKEVQEWLGHASVRSTEVYAHLLFKSKESMAKSVGSTLSVPKTALLSAISDV
ncbi:MAG: site-specific integrase [Oscillospiraceae bacterium]|nr:site-specific integrase [Oscillospiraceae bacterium]